MSWTDSTNDAPFTVAKAAFRLKMGMSSTADAAQRPCTGPDCGKALSQHGGSGLFRLPLTDHEVGGHGVVETAVPKRRPGRDKRYGDHRPVTSGATCK